MCLLFGNTKRSVKLVLIASLALVFAVFVATTMTLSKNVKATSANSTEIAKLENEKTSLQDDYEYYSYLVNDKSTDEIIEAAAREKGYVYPGEVTYFNDTSGAKTSSEG